MISPTVASQIPAAEARARRGAANLLAQAACLGLLAPIVVFAATVTLYQVDVPVEAAGLLSLVVVIFFTGLFLKFLVTSKQPVNLPIVHTQVLAESHPKLDSAGFNEWRRELMLLGFEPLGGCRILDENGTIDHQVFDVWAHPIYLCYAVIDQVLPYSGPARPIRLTYSTGFGQRWWFDTPNAEIGRIAFVFRTRRGLWLEQPGAGTETLLRAHLERREDVLKEIELQPQVPLSMENFMNGQSVRFAAFRDILRTKSPILAWYELLMFPFMQHAEWLGEAAVPRS